jgi:hypothetical protein
VLTVAGDDLGAPTVLRLLRPSTAALLHDAERRNELLTVAEHHWPIPAAHPAPGGPARPGGGCARWAAIHRPRRQAVGLVQQECQP